MRFSVACLFNVWRQLFECNYFPLFVNSTEAVGLILFQNNKTVTVSDFSVFSDVFVFAGIDLRMKQCCECKC